MKETKNVKLIVRIIGSLSIISGIYLGIANTNFTEIFYPIMIGASLIVATLTMNDTENHDPKICNKNFKNS